VARPRKRWEDAIQRDAANLLRIRNWKSVTRDKEEEGWETMARKRVEAP
jgi:hypothetical protein